MPTPRERYERQVELHDGRTVGSWSREWMEECEARLVANLPTQNQRRAYILRIRVGNGKWTHGRGDAAADALEQRARAVFAAAVAARKAQRESDEWCG